MFLEGEESQDHSDGSSTEFETEVTTSWTWWSDLLLVINYLLTFYKCDDGVCGSGWNRMLRGLVLVRLRMFFSFLFYFLF